MKEAEKRILFIYTKDRVIKCLSVNEARSQNEDLTFNGWVHTATIDPARWIEKLINEHTSEEDIFYQLNQLSFLKQ